MSFLILCNLFRDQLFMLFSEHAKVKTLAGTFWLLFCWIAKFPILVVAVLIVWILDFITGIMYAWRTHTINSKKWQEGLVKIFLYGIVILTAFVLDHSLVDFLKFIPSVQSFWDMHHPFVQIMSGFIVVNDSISIFENAGKMGVPIPKIVMKRLTDVKDNLNNA